MIPLETVFELLDAQRASTLEMLENPDTRDAFAFGDITGRLRALALFREGLNEIVESNQRGSDDNG